MNMNVDPPRIIQALGCMRQMQRNPQVVFKSLFIRPEDLKHYSSPIDFIKICGRTLGREFLEKPVTEYIEGRYEGNLLDLMDLLDWMAESFHIANAQLPDNYFATASGCHRLFGNCSYCTDLFNLCAFRLELHMRDFRS